MANLFKKTNDGRLECLALHCNLILSNKSSFKRHFERYHAEQKQETETETLDHKVFLLTL